MLKTIKQHPDTMTARIIRAILESEGIDSFIANENLANGRPTGNLCQRRHLPEGQR
ncbi:DUF2007 domain-containing protein [bacterium]|jgi:hypothetical protein|nr:DUF2007 domain-containing protein [bacterium]